MILKITQSPVDRYIRLLLTGLIFALLLCAPVAGIELKKIHVDEAARDRTQLIFIDARPLSVWQQGHIEGARSFSWENYTRVDSDGVKYRTFPPEELAEALGRMGIGHADAVVVYGDADTSWGGEGWAAWVLAWLGHQGTVYALDGGISLWREKGYPMAQGSGTDFAPKAYEIDVQPSRQIRAADIQKAGKSVTLVDTRSYFTEWLPGHLPGAVHISWEKFYQGDHHQFISPDQLRALLADKGVDPDKPVIYYCTGGIRSGFAWMVHELSGLGHAENFEGGMEAWGRMMKNN